MHQKGRSKQGRQSCCALVTNLLDTDAHHAGAIRVITNLDLHFALADKVRFVVLG
jgi:hypothetical protein